MAVTNRALSAPLSVWGDQSDVMAVRDTGWIQLFTENGQEAVDNVICAFRIGEDPRVLLPVMVHLDGFYMSHVIESIVFPEQSQVDKFLPPFKYPMPLHPDKPVTMGAFAMPVLYSEAKKAQQVNLEAAKEVILECWEEFGKLFGRHYLPVERYRSDDAQVLLLTVGGFSETAMTAVDRMREEGRKVGLVRFRLWRPFPFAELRQAVKNAETLIVLDRALSFGGPGGPICSEVKSALYGEAKRPKVVGFVGGLGGRDITPAEFEDIVNKGIEISQKGSDKEFEIYGVRE